MSHTPYRVYLLTNTVTGMRYVGMTGMPLAARFANHGCRSSSLHGEFVRYGRDAFTIQTLEVHEDGPTAYMRESQLIVELKTMRPHGYNRMYRGAKFPGVGGAGPGNTNSRRTSIAMYYRTRLVGEFDNVCAAADYTGVHRTAIQRALRKPHYRPGGFRVVQQGTAA